MVYSTRMLTRPPQHPALHGLVDLLWVGAPPAPIAARERIIPTGQVHLAWRACGTPIVVGPNGDQLERFGVLGGPRAQAHIHDTPRAVRSVGAMLRPGALPRLFGTPARALLGQHVGLDARWGAHAVDLQEQLAAVDDQAALALVERSLVAHLRVAGAPTGLQRSLHALEGGASVRAIADALGRSPRAVNHWFADAVGLSPCEWRGVRRLQRALTLAASERDWSVVAYRAGYADHAHLSRAMRAISGVTPTQWRQRGHPDTNHLPAR